VRRLKILWINYGLEIPKKTVVNFVLKHNLTNSQDKSEVFSLIANKPVRLSHGFLHFMYMVESLPVSRALDAQEARVRHQCSQLKVIRNQDDLVSRKLKAEVNSLQKRTKYTSGGGDFDELQRISELVKSESGQQGSLTPRGGARRPVISHTIDISANDRSPVMSENLSSSDSPIHIPKKINRTQTSTIANQQDYKVDKSGARNSLARMMSHGPAMPKKSYQKGVSMVPGSKHFPDNIELMNEVHPLLLRHHREDSRRVSPD
jgi:hypothetical protein